MISLEKEAEEQGKLEAWNFFKEQHLMKKALDDGFFYSNEMTYYKSFLEKLIKKREESISPQILKKITKFKENIDTKLNESKPQITNLALTR